MHVLLGIWWHTTFMFNFNLIEVDMYINIQPQPLSSILVVYLIVIGLFFIIDNNGNLGIDLRYFSLFLIMEEVDNLDTNQRGNFIFFHNERSW